MSKKITVVGTEQPSASADWFKELMNKEDYHIHKQSALDNKSKIGQRCEARRNCNNTDLHYCEHCKMTLCSRHWS